MAFNRSERSSKFEVSQFEWPSMKSIEIHAMLLCYDYIFAQENHCCLLFVNCFRTYWRETMSTTCANVEESGADML